MIIFHIITLLSFYSVFLHYVVYRVFLGILILLNNLVITLNVAGKSFALFTQWDCVHVCLMNQSPQFDREIVLKEIQFGTFLFIQLVPVLPSG